MKRIILICLTMVMIFGCFSACNKADANENEQISKFSVSVLESELRGSDNEFKFVIEETANGFSFEYNKDYMLSDFTYSGTADEKQNVSNITIVYNNINNEIITNKSRMSTALDHLLNDSGSVTLGEATAANCFIDLLSLHKVVGVENASTDAILSIICEGQVAEVNGWSISVKVIGSTVTTTMKK